MKYPDFDQAIIRCLEELQGLHFIPQVLYLSKSDMRSAFRNLGMMIKHFKFLVLKARNPIDKQWYYFIDKCLPFGTSISCAHFQNFSNAVAHIVQVKIERRVINYLDDFLFVSTMKIWCDGQIRAFLQVCETIDFPVSMEKTFWGEERLVFLGLLIDSRNRLVCIPQQKITKALLLIRQVLEAKNSKVTMHQMQKLCGFLNFIG